MLAVHRTAKSLVHRLNVVEQPLVFIACKQEIRCAQGTRDKGKVGGDPRVTPLSMAQPKDLERMGGHAFTTSSSFMSIAF
jgi:prolyl-tRNA editing enzyme YbaK/EbsC (Cys-tRNA(Pro) deacylase)